MTTDAKPRFRVQAGTADSFVNFQAKVGWGAGNQGDYSGYQLTYISRNRVQLEAMYRGSWIVGQAVDAVAEDMTRAGITIHSDLPPDQIETLGQDLRRMNIWPQLASVIKWARLYGGAVGLMLIDGQHLASPLRPETIARGQFRGILPLDRWQVQPSMTDLVEDYGPHLGQPRYYDVVAAGGGLPAGRIHYSRLIRFDGVELPWWQRQAENGWGLSVVERLYDRLIAFDSSTLGAAQLAYKAHLRVMKIDGLRDLIASGGKAMDALTEWLKFVRLGQTNEGLTVVDAKDEFQTHAYTFTGLDSLLLQFGQQLSGALQIPLVRLFGQSPAGLNSTGESDLRMYYDAIKQQQEGRLGLPMDTLLDVMCRSSLGIEPPASFAYSFNPLWQLSDAEKATTGKAITEAVLLGRDAGIVSDQVALRELRQQSRVTGMWTNITDEDIAAAEDRPLPPIEALPPVADPKPTEEPDAPPQADD